MSHHSHSDCFHGAPSAVSSIQTLAGAVPVLVVVDEAHFGYEAIQDELGPAFRVVMAEGLVGALQGVNDLHVPLVVVPALLEPTPGTHVLAELHAHRARFVGVLMVDDERQTLGEGSHVVVRRPLKPGALRQHLLAASRIRAQWLDLWGQRDAADEVLERLRDGLRHDVRGQLQSVVGLGSFMLELERMSPTPDEERQDFLGRILASSDKLTRYIDHVGDWLQQTRRPYELTKVDLRELALEVTAELRAQFEDPRREESRDIQLSFVPPEFDGPAVVPGDARALHVALRHLLLHATEAKRQVELTLTREASGFAFEVRDFADKVMPLKHCARAFEIFERAAGGTGVGLAVVAKVAERHHGSTTVIPHPEAGHLYRFELLATPWAEGLVRGEGV